VAFSDLFTRRRREDPETSDTVSPDSLSYPTKALARFLTSLSSRPQPLLLDLGPVVGSNLTFFGERLGCKILVEDVYRDVDCHVRDRTLDQLPAFLVKRFTQETGSVDGILCWDLFDYLDRTAAQPLAKQLTRILRPEGSLLAFFGTAEPRSGIAATYSKHIVVDQATLQHRPYPAARGKQRPVLNRDIQRMFEPLRIVEQFLLKTNLREVLLRKTAEPAIAPPTPPAPPTAGA
jgi:hypothetical protein